VPEIGDPVLARAKHHDEKNDRDQEHAADGFNVMPPYFHEGFEDFVELVVPILQERGLFRPDYEGTTLRDRLGLARPANPFFQA